MILSAIASYVDSGMIFSRTRSVFYQDDGQLFLSVRVADASGARAEPREKFAKAWEASGI
jgi:hypothetical protein